MSKQAAQAENIMAVIVAYNPDLPLILKNYEAVAPQVSSVIVVDNSDTPASLENVFAWIPHALYIDNHGNQGIAHALNRAANLALQHGATWLLTLDQDSILNAGYVSGLLNYVKKQPQSENVASVGAHYLNADDTTLFGHTLHGGEVQFLITSGNLVRLSALKRVGFYREDFFVDYIDYDISFRLRKAGYQVVECHDVAFVHNLGAPHIGTVLGLRYHCTNHSPLRRYYISRNRFVFYKENMFFDPFFVIKDAWGMVKDSTKLLLGEQYKLRKIKATLTGVMDAFCMNLGKCKGNL